MKTKTLIILALVFCAQIVSAQSTAITYQGRLTDNGSPVSGSHDLRFTIYDTATSPGGNQIAGPLFVPAVGVTNGLFTVTLDFGSAAFNGNARWLEIGVRTNGSVAVHQLLLPRQSITATPYAIQAAGLSGTLPDSQLTANIARLNGSNFFNGPVNFSPTSGAPFAITGSSSNKLVKGLNADKLGGKASTDFVLKAGDTMTGPLNLPADGLAVGGSQLVLSNGNVGIGRLPTGGVRLDVAGTPLLDGDARHLLYLTDDTSFGAGVGGGLSFLGRVNSAGSRANFGGLKGIKENATEGNSAGALAFTTLPSPGSPTERMRITSGGNVGIGTTSPGEKLDVDGNVRVRGGIPYFAIKPDPWSDAAYIQGNLNVNAGAPGDYLGFSTAPGKGFLFHQSQAGSRMVIDPTGNVGIGTTGPAHKLDVNGDIGVGAGNKFTTASGNDLNLDAPATRSIFLKVGGSTKLAVDNQGNVGIGTTTPSRILHTVGDAVLFERTGQQITVNPNYGAANTHASIDGPAGKQLRLSIGDSDKVTIDSSGNVGIGTTTPETRLTVYESKENSGGEAAIIIQDYSNTDSGTDFIKALEINKYKYNIPDGVTAFGYQIGISPQVFVHDANFSGTIDNQYAIWARTGMRTIGASGARTINNAYGIYLDGLTEPGGTIHNHYGVYQEGSGTKNYFGGNVGIGTTSPQASLHVAGDARIEGDLSYGNTTRQMLSLYNANYGIGVQANREYFRSGSGFSWYSGGSHSNGDNDPGPGGARLMDIDHSGTLSVSGGGNFGGNVGIGTTSPNLSGDTRALTVSAGTSGEGIARLEVQGTRIGDNIYGALDFYHKANPTASIASYRSGADDAGNLTFWTRTSGMTLAERMRIDHLGNVGIGTTGPAAQLQVMRQGSQPASIVAGIGDQTVPAANATIVSMTTSSSAYGLYSGYRDGAEVFSVGNNGSVTALSFNPTSDRHAKAQFAAVDARQVLERLASISIQTWKFTNDTAQTRHIGPMAQDFHAAFGVGGDDKHIATVDADGVALAAIQGLNEVVKEKDAKITRLEQRLAVLEKVVAKLAAPANEP